jgi:UTP--glucose-1-phosphate uridylyltransferase
MLESLLARGKRYAFISNADNLGATLDPRILAYFAASGMPFLMEVADRTEADRKGGHLAVKDGRLILREVAQTPEEDVPAFQDTSRHRYFNTNSLWIDLEALPEELDLPLIVNRKTVDPSDASSPAVIQLETAMGAAIGSFEGAGALRVPRTRFAPVKETRDLLVLRSDAYALSDDGRLELVAAQLPLVELDSRYYKLIGDLEARFPDGPPSLRECRRLHVDGDVTFGADVVVRGDVTVTGPATIEPGTVLE